jgi:hypothetical protein
MGMLLVWASKLVIVYIEYVDECFKKSSLWDYLQYVQSKIQHAIMRNRSRVVSILMRHALTGRTKVSRVQICSKKFVSVAPNSQAPGPDEIYNARATTCKLLDIATAAAAVALVRVARAARAVAMTRSVDFALNDDAVGVITVVTVHEQGQDSSDEEEDNVPVQSQHRIHCVPLIVLT